MPIRLFHSLDSVYNEHLLTIGQLQDEVKALKRQLAQKDAEMLAKDRTIAELRSEMIDIKEFHESRYLKAKAAAQVEQDRLTVSWFLDCADLSASDFTVHTLLGSLVYCAVANVELGAPLTRCDFHWLPS